MFVICSVNCNAAEEANENVPLSLEWGLWEKIVIVSITAIFAFLSSSFLEYRKQKRKPKKQLSYDTEIKEGLVAVEGNIKEKVKVLYSDQLIENLYYVACDVENTGNKVVKDQYIRFEFPKGTDILNSFFEPTPERETNVEELQDPDLELHEKRYRIGHLERKQQVGYRFILTGSTRGNPKLHPFNEAGDVDFVHRSIRKISEEMDDITRFVTLFLLFLIIPQLFYIAPFVGSTAAAVVRLIIFIYMIPLIKPFAKVISSLLLKYSSARTDETKIRERSSEIGESGSVVMAVDNE
jgi:hypothetical protein